jgi:uncharacterized protein (DUF488 family)
MHPIWTLGHSTLAPEDFIRLIQGAGIQAIADVRSIPFSGRQPHYSSPNLGHLLEKAGIRHVYLGDLVGGRPRHSGLYTPTGRADFRAMAQSEWFLRGLERILAGLEKMSIGLMCGEEDPLPCHRGLLIAPELVARGLEPRHLRKGGRVETQRELEGRMLAPKGTFSLPGGIQDQVELVWPGKFWRKSTPGGWKAPRRMIQAGTSNSQSVQTDRPFKIA